MTTATRPPIQQQVEPFDPYALPPQAIEDPPKTLWLALRRIGPGLILAGAIVGTGELIATTHLGAKVGFALLWLVIGSCFIKVFVQFELGRYSICSGRTTFEAFNEIRGVGALIAWCWVAMMLTTQLQVGAMVGGIGQACHMAMPAVSPALASALENTAPGLCSYITAHPEFPWAVLTALATSIILGIGGYGMIEKGSTFLVATFTFVTVACVALLPAAGHPIDWNEVKGGLAFRIPDIPGAMAAAFAMLGITGVGATELVAYPYWCIEKGYARKAGKRDESPAWLARARGWLRVMRLDVWVSLAVYTLATIAFYFLGAAVLHGGDGKGLPEGVKGMLQSLSQMYAPVLGQRAAVWFIVAGVFAVLYSTLYAATASNSRALVDFLQTNAGARYRTPSVRRNVLRLVCVLFPILDLGLFIAIGQPVMMVLIGGFAQALTLPMIAAAAIYLRYRRTDRRLTPGLLWDIFLWLSLAGLLGAAMYGVWDNWQKWMK